VRCPRPVYLLDYGYLKGTTAGDGEGIDIRFGSIRSKTLTGLLCTFDNIKRDAEIKLLIGCPRDDIQIIQQLNNEIYTLLIPNPLVNP
jgi:inorganic pyrophosphatase